MNKEEIIKRISICRLNANLSARALSQKIEMNDGYINRLETKKDFLPSLEVFLKILDALNVSASKFFYYDINQYDKDIEIINLLNKASSIEKEAYITLLNRK